MLHVPDFSIFQSPTLLINVLDSVTVQISFGACSALINDIWRLSLWSLEMWLRHPKLGYHFLYPTLPNLPSSFSLRWSLMFFWQCLRLIQSHGKAINGSITYSQNSHTEAPHSSNYHQGILLSENTHAHPPIALVTNIDSGYLIFSHLHSQTVSSMERRHFSRI